MPADHRSRGSGADVTVSAVHTVPAAAAARLFAPERPGPMIYAHITTTGLGRCRADRTREPRTALAELPGGNVACRGEPVVVPDLRGFVEAPPAWVPALRATGEFGVWDRIVAVLPDGADPAVWRPVRRLTAADAPGLAALEPSLGWISETWGGHPGLAASGMAWGAFHDGHPVAVSFDVADGSEHEPATCFMISDYAPRG